MRLEQYVAGVEQKRNAGALGYSAYGGLAFRPILWEAGEGLSPKIQILHVVGLPTILSCDPWMSHLMYAKAVQRLNQ